VLPDLSMKEYTRPSLDYNTLRSEGLKDGDADIDDVAENDYISYDVLCH
jgi:hypothetical protein